MNRKATPDILGALMGKGIKQENGKEIKPERSIEVKEVSNKAIKKASKKFLVQSSFYRMEPRDISPEFFEVSKEKATFNLSKAVLNELEDCWMEIRKLRGDKKISKTDIVEQALEDAIKEFRLKKEFGKFYGKLESNKAIK